MELNELQIKWLKALRSGKYKQGTFALHRSNGTFCCLGVLCDIGPWNGEWKECDIGVFNYHIPGKNELTGRITGDMGALVGLTQKDLDELIKLNDNKKLTFEQIADELEQSFWKE